MSYGETLAIKYFNIANLIAGFYVVQTILFLNELYKEPVIVNAICSARGIACGVAIVAAVIYIATIFGCSFLQSKALKQHGSYDGDVLLASLLRAFVILSLLGLCIVIITQLVPLPGKTS